MFALYKKVLEKANGLVPVEELIGEAASEVNNKLVAEGYPNLSRRQQAILFVALCDIIVVVKDGTHYLATFNNAKIRELSSLGRIIPNDGEVDLTGVDRLMRNNTKELVSQYLLQGKFHLIRLNIVEKCKTSFTLVSCTGMNPYPSFDNDEVIYSLSNLAVWHNNLCNMLTKGVYKLKTDEKYVICHNYLGRAKSVCTGGVLLVRDLNDTVKEIPLWSIKSYQPYSDNEFVQSLLSGVVRYDGKAVTLNRDILEKYYGARDLYTKLESKGVRYRYCLEELLCIGIKYTVAHYVNKYALDIYDCTDIYDLEQKLRSAIAKEKKHSGVNARVLGNAGQIIGGHTSYYLHIDLDKLSEHSVESIDDVSTVMPKPYAYYAISPQLGYNGVVVNAVTEGSAMTLGQKEFERQFGGNSIFCGLCIGDKVIKGSRGYKIGIDIQKRLCQNIMYGYKDNYDSYAKIIRQILETNGVVDCPDEWIQLLFINNLARKHKRGSDVSLSDVMMEFIAFCDIAVDEDKCQAKLVEERTKISLMHCQKAYKKIVGALPNLDGFKVDDTPKGRYIVTEYGHFKLGQTGVNKTVELYYHNEFLGRKVLQC